MNSDKEKYVKLRTLLEPRNDSDVRSSLARDIVGHGHSIARVANRLQEAAFLKKRKGPRSVFMLLGESGLGKSHLAFATASALGHGDAFLELDMASYRSHNQTTDLIGNEPSYTNASPGLMTDFVRQNPECTILLRNIDAAHPAIIRIVGSMLAEGRLADSFGFYEGNDPDNDQIADRVVDFSRAVVFMTSSVVDPFWEQDAFAAVTEDEGDSEEKYTMALDALSAVKASEGDGVAFTGDFLSAVGASGVVLFSRLSMSEYQEIGRRALNDFASQLARTDLTIQPPDAALLNLAILRAGPDIKANSIVESVFTLFIRPLLVQLDGDKSISSVQWLLSDDARIALDALIKRLGDEPIRYVFRKGIRVTSAVTADLLNGVLTLSINAVSSGKYVSIKDGTGSGAISFEVPEGGFDQIAGHVLIKEKLTEVLGIIRDPAAIAAYGAKPPRGMLLYGTPGTGKTMLAKALAAEADLPFIGITGTELLNPNFCRQVFARARRYSPSIVFIDEIDVLGDRSNEGHTLSINQLLSEIDGFATGFSEPVFVIAATNYPDAIDSALLRSGRIDMHYEVPPLDREAREYFLGKFEKLPFDQAFDYPLLLEVSAGLSGAQFEQVRQQLVMDMVKLGRSVIEFSQLVELLHEKRFGRKSNLEISQQDRRLLAYHEAGHAVVSTVLNPEHLIQFVTIAPRGDALGYVLLGEHERHVRKTRKELLEDMAVMLAGRISERLSVPQHEDCAGASSDIARATQVALRGIAEFGLDSEIGNISFRDIKFDGIAQVSAELLMRRISAWMAEAESVCQTTLTTHWTAVTRLAEALLSNELVSGEDVVNIVNESRS